MSIPQNPSVQDIIDALAQVENHNVSFEVGMYDIEGFSIDYKSIELAEYFKSDGSLETVSLEVKFTHGVKELSDVEDDESPSPYLDEHRPENQLQIEGVPVNPKLRDNFDSTDNDFRDDREIADWWGRPFIRTCSWFDIAETYSDYLERVQDLGGVNPKSPETFAQDQEESRVRWFESWPTGIRYDVRCLDGGAWDRSTNLAQVGDLQSALSIAISSKDIED